MVNKTRNNGTLTEAAFWAMFKNALRKLSMYWKPGEEHLKSVRRLNRNLDKPRQQYEYPCNMCKQWFSREEVDKDHIDPCGGISSFKDISRVAEKMFIEVDGGWQCLCKPCHSIRSKAQRKVR